MLPKTYENEFILHLTDFRLQLQLCANFDKPSVNLWGLYFHTARYPSLCIRFFYSRVIFVKVLENFTQFSQGPLLIF